VPNEGKRRVSDFQTAVVYLLIPGYKAFSVYSTPTDSAGKSDFVGFISRKDQTGFLGECF